MIDEQERNGTKLSTLIDYLFPRRCAVCDEILDRNDEYVCNKCRPQIIYIQDPRCAKCGRGLRKEEKEFCLECERKQHSYIQGCALYDYGSMSDSISRFKYCGRAEYAEFYGSELYRHRGAWLSMIKPDALIPVPIHKSRMRTRGYNQAELIAAELSKRSGIPVNTTLISRSKKTAPSKNLSSMERQNNLKSAFKILGNDVKLDTIVIIDDIYTTGSTVDAMSHVLQEAGIPYIFYLALTIGRGI